VELELEMDFDTGGRWEEGRDYLIARRASEGTGFW